MISTSGNATPGYRHTNAKSLIGGACLFRARNAQFDRAAGDAKAPCTRLPFVQDALVYKQPYTGSRGTPVR